MCSAPKMPRPAPVIERQPTKQGMTRQQVLAMDNGEDERRRAFLAVNGLANPAMAQFNANGAGGFRLFGGNGSVRDIAA